VRSPTGSPGFSRSHCSGSWSSVGASETLTECDVMRPSASTRASRALNARARPSVSSGRTRQSNTIAGMRVRLTSHDGGGNGAALFRVLCCPDSFKGTATAREAAEAMAVGVRDAGAEPVVAPMADGGEGTAELLADASPSAARHDVTVADAVGRPATAAWWNLGDGRAVLDLASASGLPAVADVKDARAASTRGTGELIRDCLNHGIRDLTVCLGGSATTDGGSGIV